MKSVLNAGGLGYFIPMKSLKGPVLFFVVCLAALNLRAEESLAEFQSKLKAAATHPRFSSAMLGIKVESLDTGKVIFEQNADKFLKPASNGKMYTGAMALDRLGPDFKIRTSFYATAPLDKSGTIKGDLIVYGRGDPSLSHRFNDGDYQKPIDQLADALVQAGVKRIKGNLVGDESFFRGTRFGVGWSVDDLQYYYGAEASALTLQENTVDLVLKPGAKIGDPLQILTKPQTDYMHFSNRTKTVEKGGRRSIEIYRPIDSGIVYAWGSLPLGDSGYDDSVAVYDAPRWFVYMLRNALLKRGVKVGGELKNVSWLDRELDPIDFAKLKEVAFIESRPMAEMVKNMMKPSQNLYAHLLLLQVGEHVRNDENRKMNSDDLGLAEMKKFCADAGIEKGAVLMEEGSGLSRGCVLKPAASVQLLKYMSKHKYAAQWRDSLPIAGVDGTLKSRFKGTLAENNLRAKTGTIRYVNSISGYVTSKAGEHLVFSIMLNAYSGGDGRTHSDAIAAMLATLAVRTDAKSE
jgi:D-alanyl-D-alanine carboxypeptidase/D-alanyl-D-alanine-endopeptidase (penicillin-binding protein 4)